MRAGGTGGARRLAVYPPLPPAIWLRRPAGELPFPLDREGHAVFQQARQGLRAALALLALEPGDELLMPAYHHGSEVETVRGAGLRCRFYDSGASVEPDPAELERLTGPRTRALYLIHHLGLPHDTARWRSWCDDRGLLLVEDAAQSWLAASDGIPVGALADVAIFCLYKSVGVPDGGAVVMRAHRPSAPDSRPLGLRTLARRHRDWLGQRSARFARASEDAVEDAGRDFGAPEHGSAASRGSRVALPRAFRPDTAARRREHFAVLRARLGQHLAPQFPALASGSSPLAFPVLTDRKPALLEHLVRNGVVQGRMWATPHPLLATGDFPGAATLRERLVGLPVHQELSAGDVDRIAEVAAAQLDG
jgi:dTDP-4-amino-4,6-dideoxygalactose transaminase